MSTIYVGIDPGPKRSAFAAVQFDELSSFKVLDCDMFGIEKGRYIADGWDHETIVAIESVEGYAWKPERSAALIQTAFVAGNIEGKLSSRFRTVLISARRWRHIVCGSPTASDDYVKRTLKAILGTLPKTNVHTRDAIGVAIAAAKLDKLTKLTGVTSL